MPPLKSNNRHCCVFNCFSKAGRERHLSFHSFPLPNESKVRITSKLGCEELMDRRKAWEKVIKSNKKITAHMKVCSLHFKEEDFFPPLPYDVERKRHVLKKTAVPSLNLPKTSHETCPTTRKPRGRPIASLSDPGTMELLTNELLEIQESNATVTTDATDNATILFRVSTKDVGVQVDEHSFTEPFVSLLDTDKKINTLTGVRSSKLLTALVDCVSQIQCDKRVRRFSVKERVILTLMKLKCNLMFAVLAVFFRTSPSTCQNIFEDTISILAVVMKFFIVFPPKEEILKNMPRCFNGFESVRVVVDCTEIGINIRKCLCCRIKTCSHYKTKHTVKFMTGVSPGGLITFISKAYGGGASDKAIFEQSKLIQLLTPTEDAVMVDKGFLVEDVAKQNFIRVIRPPFLRKKTQFNTADAILTRRIACARVHVERVNQRIKLFGILNDQIPTHMIPYVDQIFVTICGLVNLSPPILNEDKFM